MNSDSLFIYPFLLLLTTIRELLTMTIDVLTMTN